MITLPVTLTVQDLADYQTFSFRHFYQEPVGWRRIPYILIWLILCGMLLLIFSTFSPLPGKFDIYSVFYGLSCGFLTLLVFIYSRFVKSRRVIKQLSVQSGHYLLRPATFELNNDGINQVSALYHSFFAWESVIDYAESATGLYLYHGKYDGIIIPLRDIQSEAQKKDILHLLSQKIRNVQIKNQANKMA